MPVSAVASGPATDLAAAQAALVAAVTGTGAVPPGFDTGRLEIARKALLHKRSEEIRRSWPALAQSLGEEFGPRFAGWALHRPTRGSLAEGWSLARECVATDELNMAAALELAGREARFVFDGANPPVPRKIPSLQRFPGGQVLCWRGRSRVRRRRR